jgi:protein TonB
MLLGPPIAPSDRFKAIGKRDRAIAVALVAGVQLALGVALISGLRVNLLRVREAAQHLIEIGAPPSPVVRLPPAKPPKARTHQSHDAPAASAAAPGGTPGPVPARAPVSVAPVVPVPTVVPVSGGGSGSGPAAGAGSGAGDEGNGAGDDGGADLELISGEIYPRDYPKHLGNAGIGGRVSVVFTVEVDGRARQCRIERSSGIPELDALTCRLIEQRFRFRPSTDRFGRPIPDEVEWDHDWIAG